MHLEGKAKIIHQPVRLRIMGLLWRRIEVSFTEARNALGLSDGNLGNHAKVLEQEGLIEGRRVLTREGFVFRYLITHEGRQAFAEYLRLLRQFIETT